MVYPWVLGLIFALLTWLVLLRPPGVIPRHLAVFANPAGIETDGTFLRDDIHDLAHQEQVRQGRRDRFTTRIAHSHRRHDGLAGRRALAEVAYRAEVEAAGKALRARCRTG